MSKMIERMARAAFQHHHINKGLPPSDEAWRVTGNEWRGAIRAAVEAMREPTEAMAFPPWGYASGADAAKIWRVMIDEILKR